LVKSVPGTNVRAKLQRRLRFWCQLTLLGFELKVEWSPHEDRIEEGIVKDNTIFVFASNPDRALEILDHEYVDWLVAKAIRPYQHIINGQRVLLNALFKYIEDQAYGDKELVIDALAKLLSPHFHAEEKE
jgi:hypothetical protein